MIHIDDAGWGSLVGGVLIGACRAESPLTQHAFREIPVGHFQGDLFPRQAYLDVASQLALELLDELQAAKEEAVYVCTGYVLSRIRGSLQDKGYHVVPAKIGEPLQSLIENEFLDRILALGIETDYEIMTGAQGLYFWQCVKWLKGGDVEHPAPLPEREKQCKTGWSTYSIWAHNPYSKAKLLSKQAKSERRFASRW